MDNEVRKVCEDYAMRERLISDMAPCKFRDDLAAENARLLQCVRDAIDFPDYVARKMILSIAYRRGYMHAGITIMCECTFKRYKAIAIRAIMCEYGIDAR